MKDINNFYYLALKYIFFQNMNSCSSISVGMQNYVTSRAYCITSVVCKKPFSFIAEDSHIQRNYFIQNFLYPNIKCSCSLHLYTCIQEIPFTHSRTHKRKIGMRCSKFKHFIASLMHHTCLELVCLQLTPTLQVRQSVSSFRK